MANATCSQLWDPQGPTRPIESNPDIAGYGVLIAFVTTAYSTLILVIAYYGSGCDPEALSNPVDAGIVHVTKRWPVFRSIHSSKLDWKIAFEKAILRFSDQQLVTGLAILISAFAQLSSSSGSITAYHWQLMVYTAWFASLTHLTTLTIIRKYFREMKKARFLRLCLMTLLMSMLVVALIPTGSTVWLQNDSFIGTAGIPAQCFFRLIGMRDFYRVGDATFMGMAISIFVLSASHFIRAIKVSTSISDQCLRWLKERPLNYTKTAARKSFDRPNPSTVKYLVSSIVFSILLATLDLFTSLAWEIMWLIFALLWGSLHLVYTRRGYFADFSGPPGATVLPKGDNVLSFGQCTALILLILPGLSLVQSYFELNPLSAKTTNHSAAPQTISNANPENTNATPKERRMIRMGARFYENDVVSTPSHSQSLEINQRGTDLQNMENEVGVIFLGHTVGSSGGPSGHSSLDPRKPPLRRINLVTSESLYRFEWFRILILMMFIFIFFWITTIIIITFHNPIQKFYLLAYGFLALEIVIMAVCISLWASTCVLSVFLQPNHKREQTTSRALWYLWYIALVGSIIVWMSCVIAQRLPQN